MNQKKLDLKYSIIWALIMAAGAILLFTGITRESLWYDESYTAAIANHTLVDIINITGGDSHPPLYYLMLRVFRLVFGNSVLSLRTFSVLGALALAAWGIGPVRRALGDRTGLIYSIVTLSLPITLAMAQETRMYTWAAFWVTGSALYGYLAHRDSKTRDWAIFGLCSLAAAYTHYYALLAVLMIFALLLLGFIIEKKKVLPFLCVAGAVVAGYIPWLIKLAGQMSRVTGSYWIPKVTGQVIKNVFVYPFSNKFSIPQSQSLVSLAFLLVAVLILWGIISRIIRRDESVKMAILATGAYILTIGAGIVASNVIRPVLVERYMIPVLGLFILGLSYGVANLGKKVMPVIACVLIMAVSVPQTYYTMTNRFNGPMTEAAAYLTPQIEAGDVFVHTDEHTLGTFCYYFPNNTNYYYQREGFGGYSNYDAFKPNGLLINSLDEIAKDHRVWLVQRFGASDTVTASGWMGSGLIRPDGAPTVFQIQPSWYSFSVYKATIGEPGTAGTTESAAGSGTMTVKISNFRNDQGNALVLLYNQDPMTQAGLLNQLAPIKGGQAETTFSDIPYGNYAVMVFHDENNNQQADLNNNVPTEGFGYSNNFLPPGGPPEFEKCKIRFEANNSEISIPIFYFDQQ